MLILLDVIIVLWFCDSLIFMEMFAELFRGEVSYLQSTLLVQQKIGNLA